MARVIGTAVTLLIFFGGLWCSTNIRANEVSWFGLSPECTGRLGAGVFLVLFIIIMKNLKIFSSMVGLKIKRNKIFYFCKKQQVA
tara:strand:+ start:311 stop:565 length:255 start_codon:yes stop_codon:yes gene_type:complete